MEKIIDSLSDLNLEEPINAGNCSSIYAFSDDAYFKLLNEDYRNLDEMENEEVLETLLALQEITNTPSIAIPRDIYRSQSELYGYTSKVMPGVELKDLSVNTDISLITGALTLIKPEVAILSGYHIKTEDIGGDNILFSDHISIIDLELSLVDKYASLEYLYSRTMYGLFTSLLISIYGANITRKIASDELSRLNVALKNGESDDYEGYILLANSIIEDMTFQKIENVCQGREAFQKLKGRF